LIRYLKNSEIDTEKWDGCIKSSFNGIIYAYAWYLDIVHENWEALVEDDYIRVMPLPASKKMGISYIMQPFFMQQLGIFSKNMLTPDIVRSFIDNIPEKFKIVDINLNSYNTIDGDDLVLLRNDNYVLDLINKYAVLSKKYSSNTKRNLKKSLKKKLTLAKGIKPEGLISLFKENRGKRLKKWSEPEYDRLKRLMYRVLYKGSGLLYGVFDEHNQLCAGAFFTRTQNRLIFLFSATNDAGKESAAMTFLIDSIIRKFSPNKLVLDFEGSNEENLARFYKGFGAKRVTYIRLQKNTLGILLRWLFRLRLFVKNR